MTACCVMLGLLRKQIVCSEVGLRIVFGSEVCFVHRDIDDVLLRFFTRHCDGSGGFIGVW